MNFRDATDRLTDCVTLARMADKIGVAENTVARARMDDESPNARRPPDGWQAAIARLARLRAQELVNLATDLEGEAGE